MVIRPSASTIRSFSAYAEAAKTASAADGARRAARGLADEADAQLGAKAHVKKQSFGFSLGKFGVDFTSQTVEVAPPPAQETATTGLRFSQVFAEAVDSLNATADLARSRPKPSPPSTGLTRKQGLAAYARATEETEVSRTPGMLLGSI